MSDMTHIHACIRILIVCMERFANDAGHLTLMADVLTSQSASHNYLDGLRSCDTLLPTSADHLIHSAARACCHIKAWHLPSPAVP